MAPSDSSVPTPDHRAIGKPMRRKEDFRLLTGRGRFSDDFSLPGQAYAAIVRSPHPHARIAGIDGAWAQRMPGVLGIFTAADCRADSLRPIPHDPVPSTKFDMKLTGPRGAAIFIGPHDVLAVERVRHVGEAVALVVADSPAAAHDAAEAVEVTYDALPFNTATALAATGAPAVWDEVRDNVLVDTEFGDKAATDRAFANAAHVVAMDFHIDRVTAVPIEPRAALGSYDAGAGRYTLFAGSGGAVRQRREIAHILGVDPARLRVLSADVGGNFGSRNRVYAEFPLVVWAARKLGRPVKYTATRSEAFLSDYQGRDLATRVELALDRDGRFLALRADNISNVGARCVSLSPLGKGAGLITGSYDIPAATLRARAVFTNTMSTQAYRSSGRPEVNFAIERLIDTAARDLGIERVALRRRNLVTPGAMPYVNAVGARYDSGTYEANMDLALRIADWAGFPARRTAALARGRLAGRGMANYVESSIGSPRERATIAVRRSGTVDVVIGTQPSGQGHETSFAQVIAERLGVAVASVNIILGDTDVVSLGGGSHSGRSMRHAGTVMSMAADDLIAKGRQIAARVLGCAEAQFGDGRFSAANSNRSLDWFELAAEAGDLAVTRDNEMHDPVFPNGCAVCEVEVDADTGGFVITRYAAVDDVGRCINPMIVHGQTHGGIVQGVGQAMGELIRVDPETGQPLAGSLLDYALPRADAFPFFTTEIVEVLSPTNPLGIKAGGEGGTTPALSVIVNAVVDALAHLGVRDIKMPLTPFAVWSAIQRARSAA